MEWLILVLVAGTLLPLGAALWALTVRYQANTQFSFALAMGIGLLAGAAGGLLVSLVVLVVALGLKALR